MARGEDVTATLRAVLGTKYVWGGQAPGGFDCSGLAYWAYAQHGVAIPRTTYEQINVGYAVQPDKLRPGDLVFFDTDRKKTGPDHVGIYLGGGKFIHAPAPGQGVKISSLADSYYMDRWMAGRRIPGVGSGPGLPEDAPRLDAHELAERYGMSYAFFKSQPELMGFLKSAVAEQWSPQKFGAEVKNSSWWRKNSETVRQAQLLQKTDPATYKAQMEAARVAAGQAAVKMGAILPDNRIQELAKNMVHLGWNDAQVANYLGSYVKWTADHTLGGLAGQAEKAIRGEARNLGVAVTEQSVLNNAQYIVRGLTTMEKIQAGLREQAAGLYPAFAEQIKAGAGMSDLAQPYVQVLAGELQLPESDVSVFTPKIKAALNRVDAKGQPAPMGLDEFTQLVRNDPAWRRTPQAAEKAFNVGKQVLADMGLAGGGNG